MLLCPACHSENPDHARTCSSCAADLSFHQLASQQTQRLLVLAEQAASGAHFQQALDLLSEAERLTPRPFSPDVFLLRARCHAALGRYLLALKIIEGLGFAAEEAEWNKAQDRRDAARAHYNWALHLAKKGLHRTAQAELAKALELFEELPQALVTQAKYRLEAGEPAAALDLIYRALKADPDHAAALRLLFDVASTGGSNSS